MKRHLSIARTAAIAAALLLGPAGFATAGSFDSLDRLSQAQFDKLVGNLGAAVQYKGVTPAEPLGTIGFDVGVEVSYTEIDRGVFKLAGGDSSDTLDSLVVPRLHAHKGLPGGVDVGAFVGVVAGSDLTVLGAELRLALLRGGIATPALGVRLAASRLQGSDDLDLSSYSGEVLVSKGFVMFTPYGGVGRVRSDGDARNGSALDDATIDENKVFVGVNVNLGFNLTFEADVTGDYTTYSAKAGLRF